MTLTICRKFISIVQETFWIEKDAVIVIGDIRADIKVVPSEAECKTRSFNIYYVGPEEGRFSYNDKEKLDTLVKSFKEGKLMIDDEVVTIVNVAGKYKILFPSVGVSSALHYQLRDNVLIFIDKVGKKTYYRMNASYEIVITSYDPQLHSECTIHLDVRCILRIMTLFEKSTHYDINMTERQKLKNLIRSIMIKDVANIIIDYILENDVSKI